MRQGQGTSAALGPDGTPSSPPMSIDTMINSLTFMFGSNHKDLETLMTREFNADPNLHKNPNVELVGDYTTGGSPIEQFEWAWKWRPPKVERDKGEGWRNSCSVCQTVPCRECGNLLILCHSSSNTIHDRIACIH